MKRNLVLGYIEPTTEANPGFTQIQCLPQHPVMRPKKPCKVRIMFDCAANYEGVSVNDRLLWGPDLTTPLVEVLNRLKVGKFTVAADIIEVFLQ